MNYVFIAGHLVADVETRMTSTGQRVVTFRMATNSRRKGKEEVTMWWRITIWGDRFDKMIPYLKKGSSVMVAGELLKPELYKDKTGQSQIGNLEIWASNIWFNPFGKTDKTAESGEQAGSYSAQGGSPAQPYGDNPFSQPAQAPFAAAGAFMAGQPMFGQGPQGFPEDNEDNDLPF